MSDELGTLRWFGATWGAPVNDPRAEIPVPLGEDCLRCHFLFDSADRGLAVAASTEISASGQVFYHLECWLDELGVPHV